MTKYMGVDWASNGWFGVILHESGEWETDLFPSIWSLWKYHSDAERICIDIPIGLPSSDKRTCDIEAKQKLKHRQQSVFYTPIRKAVYQQNLDTAKEINEAEAGFSIQNQAWSVLPRIREVDEFLDMNPSARDRLLETHPELCFYGLNGRTPLDASKTTKEGQDTRRRLLLEEYADAGAIIHDTVDRYMTPEYAPMIRRPDNIFDAVVSALTARLPPDDRGSLPATPEKDERGLPMRIVYPDPMTQTRLPTAASRS